MAAHRNDWRSWLVIAKKRQPGIAPQKGEHGIVSMESVLPHAFNLLSAHVNTAGPSTLQKSKGMVYGSAQISARCAGGITLALIMKSVPARIAARASGITSTSPNDSAPANAVSKAAVSVAHVQSEPTIEPVYNLAAGECHKHIANGVFVHICDALRYYVNTCVAKWRIGE